MDDGDKKDRVNQLEICRDKHCDCDRCGKICRSCIVLHAHRRWCIQDTVQIMCSHELCVVVMHISCCFCFAAYEMFQGFEAFDETTTDVATTATTSPLTTNATGTTDSLNTPTMTTSKTHHRNLSDPFTCPEEEQPANIGPYEVPTQRDLALLTKKTLKRMFGIYHQKALFFLDDIKKATRATSAIHQKCHGNKDTYKRCVKHVSHHCELITKSLVMSLERQRNDVAAFTENDQFCSVAGMKTDPVKLVKILAMEDVSLDFALPAFLRILSACTKYCKNDLKYEMKRKPIRHMTDADLVVKHLLTKKNYRQLIF